jgi:thiamine biosynthesis lipoprotein
MRSKATIDRRDCLKLIAALGLGSAVPAAAARPAAAAVAGKHEVSRTLPLMGTLVTITVFDESRQKVDEALERAFGAMRKAMPVFDRFDPGSRIAHLNDTGLLRDVPPGLGHVMRASSQLHEASRGMFDITVLPLLRIYKRTLQEKGRPPAWGEVREAASRTGFERVRISSGEIRLLQPGMQITLDGIAKGYIVDLAAESLRADNIQCALINAGGDIRAVGSKGGVPWRIGVRDPGGRKSYVRTIRLSDMAVATSGSYENHFDPLARHNHLIDAEAKGSPRRTVSATAVASSAMLADGLSTAFFVLEPEKAITLAESLAGVQATIFARGGRSFCSSGWADFES